MRVDPRTVGGARPGGAGGRGQESGGSERVLAGLHLALEGEAGGWVRWGEDGDGRMWPRWHSAGQHSETEACERPLGRRSCGGVEEEEQGAGPRL